MTIHSTGLIASLHRTDRLIRRLDEAGELIETITAKQAISIAQHGEFLGVIRGKHGQVRSIRPVSTRRPMPLTDAFPGRPVLWTLGYSRATAGRLVAA